MSESAHGASHYVKIWGILVVLLIISIIGPELGIKAVTLVTAFGIAIVKTYFVCAHFMHLNVEKKIMWWMLGSMLLAVFLFYAGTVVDVMRTSGHNWKNVAASVLIEKHHGGQLEHSKH
ncbi:MAG: cytochrome C oxidase subunit IV family protein [Bdellovibrionota bacterium]